MEDLQIKVKSLSESLPTHSSSRDSHSKNDVTSRSSTEQNRGKSKNQLRSSKAREN